MHKSPVYKSNLNVRGETHHPGNAVEKQTGTSQAGEKSLTFLVHAALADIWANMADITLATGKTFLIFSFQENVLCKYCTDCTLSIISIRRPGFLHMLQTKERFTKSRLICLSWLLHVSAPVKGVFGNVTQQWPILVRSKPYQTFQKCMREWFKKSM